MNILLTGASGFIGSHIESALRARGDTVKPASRQNGIDFNRLTTSKAWLPHLADIDAVVNCVGIISETRSSSFTVLHKEAPSALFRACVDAGVRRVIQISALGADEHAFTPYQLSKKAADDVLRNLPLDWFVLRPSLVYGRGGKSMAMFQRLATLPVLALMGGGRQMIQPVHINDLVETVLTCVDSHESHMTLDVVGAHPVSLCEWLQMMRRKSGKSAAPVLSVPLSLGLKIANIAHHFLPLLHPDNLRMLQQGNTADVTPLSRFLGHLPLDIETGLDKL